MKKTLKAKEEFFYDGATRKVGDQFDAADPDANILVVLGKAEEASHVEQRQPAAKPAAPKLETAAVKAEESKPADVMTTENTDLPRRRREYKRRDMTAEE